MMAKPKTIEERLSQSYTFRVWDFLDTWDLPGSNLVKDVLKKKAVRMKDLDRGVRLAFLRENDGHRGGDLLQSEVEASTRLEKLNEDIERINGRRKALERKKALEESKGNLF